MADFAGSALQRYVIAAHTADTDKAACMTNVATASHAVVIKLVLGPDSDTGMTHLTGSVLHRYVVGAYTTNTDVAAGVAVVTAGGDTAVIKAVLGPDVGAGVADLAGQIGRYVVNALAAGLSRLAGVTAGAAVDDAGVVEEGDAQPVDGAVVAGLARGAGR